MKEPLEQILKPAGINFEEFRNIGFFVGDKLYWHHETEGFTTPSKKIEIYSNQLEEWGFDPLPSYVEPPETPFSEPDMMDKYPLILTSRKESMYRHSQGRQIPSLREAKPDPIMKINKDIAENLGIKDGDWVSISTRRGSIRQKANLVDWIHPNVVEVDYAWWFPEKGPGSNMVGKNQISTSFLIIKLSAGRWGHHP